MKTEIRKAKREMWQNFLSNAQRDDVWRALEFTKPAMNMALPAPRFESGNTATSIEGKRQMLMDHAFPLPPSDPCDDYIFKPAGHFHKSISPEIIAASIWGQASKKSPGPDGIGPAALKLLWGWDPERIRALFTACTRAGLHPRMWKLARGAVIAKPGKDDYSKVKSYRVICLLSCIGKCLERVIADGISAQLEPNGGLHWGQFGGRSRRNIFCR
jgi:hypothetical protein